ncbi:hypothetical protein GPECTOR_1g64 [Gonium pectorale]|uniref:Uncharacterized protein n=1 Tax=Gonium pectorale TaxID=33097 RepID=A0A150H523_GONPE|nr:hypothetical protein GPECTOR_1g64 [Gonium pectorale]|eukprot:KXZ56710.1 hypothetical protein GPECTOR_1g64 [Gonium pectorale]
MISVACVSPEEVEAASVHLCSYLKGQGLWASDTLNVLNPSPQDGAGFIELVYRLINLADASSRALDQLREEADRRRVALGCSERKNETLEESVRRLRLEVQSHESKLLASKHKAEEEAKDLTSKLKSANVHINKLLREASKRGPATGGNGAPAATSVGGAVAGPRRVVSRFQDDLATENEMLQRDKQRLTKEVELLKKQLKSPTSHGKLGGAGSSRHGWGELQSRGPTGEDVEAQSDRGCPDSQLGVTSPESVNRVAHLQRTVQSLDEEVKHLRSLKHDLQDRCNKMVAELSESRRNVHQLRTKCVSGDRL